MSKNIFLEAEIPEDVKNEILFLYRLGIGIQELEFLIKIKFRENLNL